MTRSGGRDTSRIIEIHLFFDKQHKDDYLSICQYLSSTLQIIRPFPLLCLEENDQIIKVNDKDVRQCTVEQLANILNGLTPNDYNPENECQTPAKEQLLHLTYIKGEDLQPQKHLSKEQVNLFCFNDKCLNLLYCSAHRCPSAL